MFLLAFAFGLLQLVFWLSGLQWFVFATGGLRSVSIQTTSEEVILRALDGPSANAVQLALPFTVAGSVLGALTLGVSPWWVSVVALHAVAPAGCRLRVIVDAGAARVERRALLWTWKTLPLHAPLAWVDGWGDVLDPEALWLGERADAYKRDPRSFELGWSTCNSGDRAAEVSDTFNRAVARLRRS